MTEQASPFVASSWSTRTTVRRSSPTDQPPDVRTDPARPGFASARIWVTDRTPISLKAVREPLELPHTLEPPARRLGVPRGHVSARRELPRQGRRREVQAYFAAMGSPGASRYSAQAPHPYMQKTRTLDFCLVLEGEITLVLDTAEVHLKAGDTVVQRGTNHAWSNRSDRPCVVAFSSHDAAL